MLEDIRHRRQIMAKRYVSSTRHTIQVDWLPFCDELAEEIGCKPNIGRLQLVSFVTRIPVSSTDPEQTV